MLSIMTLSLSISVAIGCGSSGSSANAEVHVADGSRVAGVADARSPLDAHLEEYGRVDRAGIDQKPGELHSVHIGNGDRRRSRLRNQVREPQTEHHGVGVGDIDGPGILIDAGVRMRLLPAIASAELIVASEVEGVAMKKVLMASEVPASPLPTPPFAQLVPDEFVRKDGEKTQ